MRGKPSTGQHFRGQKVCGLDDRKGISMNIYEKLLRIQTELKAPKSQRNSFGGYNYRSCEDILESLKPLLKELQVVVVISDMLEQVGDRFYIVATAKLINCEKPGEQVTNTAYAREEETKKGYDASQITGSTSSYARKYALNGLFAIDDSKDADFTNTGSNVPNDPQKAQKPKETKKSSPKPKEQATATTEPQKAQPKQTAQPLNEEAMRNVIKDVINRYTERDFGGQLLAYYKVDSLADLKGDALVKALKQSKTYDEVRKKEKEEGAA